MHLFKLVSAISGSHPARTMRHRLLQIGSWLGLFCASSAWLNNLQSRSRRLSCENWLGSMTTASGAPNKLTKPMMSGKIPVSLYRRMLPTPSVSFSSPEGRTIFREALAEGNMESYFRLAEQFRTQDDPSFCGLSTLTMVLNALAVDPGRTWKGPWRWYHESMLDCCAPLDVIRAKGITLDTLVCLAKCNGLNIQLETPDMSSLEDLRETIKYCSSEDRGKVVVASYDRRGLKQTGSGHFSPVGGYHEARDMVLIMDTARFKLPPHWVPLDMLWEAMKTIDPETNKPRGFMVLEKAHNLSHKLFTPTASNYRDWPQVATWVTSLIEGLGTGLGTGVISDDSGNDTVSLVLANELQEASSVGTFVSSLLTHMHPAMSDLLTTFNSTGDCCSTEEQDGLVLQAIQGTQVYQEISRMSRSTDPEDKSYGTSQCPDGSAWGCACSSRHVLSIVTYAILSLLHESLRSRDGSEDESRRRDPLWRTDPLATLPSCVGNEARRVATILEGMVDIERANARRLMEVDSRD